MEIWAVVGIVNRNNWSISSHCFWNIIEDMTGSLTSQSVLLVNYFTQFYLVRRALLRTSCLRTNISRRKRRALLRRNFGATNSLAINLVKSPRRTDRFITPTPSTSFIYQSTKMWNDCRNTASKINFSTSTNLVKSTLKSELLSIQSRYDEIDWCELNFDSNELKF